MKKIEEGSVGGACVVCNSQPTKGEYAINTEVPFVDPAQKHLGMQHKHVCQRCAEELVPLVPNKVLDRTKAELATYKARYGAVVAALDGLYKDVTGVAD